MTYVAYDLYSYLSKWPIIYVINNLCGQYPICSMIYVVYGISRSMHSKRKVVDFP